jgi:plasmid stability protein
MKSNANKQYTIRNIPIRLDRVLRKRARDTGKSFNQTVVEALVSGVGGNLVPKRDLSFIAGSMSSEEADELDVEIKAQRQIDHEMWSDEDES